MKLLRRADSNFQLRVRKRAMPDSNFQLRVRKDPNFQGRNSIGYQQTCKWTFQQPLVLQGVAHNAINNVEKSVEIQLN